MRFIQIPHPLSRNHRIRHLAVADGPTGATLAALLGDDQHTHSVHWLALADGSETLRRAVPDFDNAADPALSPDLRLLAFVEPGEPPRCVVERPHELHLGRRIATNPPSPWEDVPFYARRLAISRNGQRLRVSLSDGCLNRFAIDDFSQTPSSGSAPLQYLDGLIETLPPASVLLHGHGAYFCQATGRAGPVDLFITAGGTVGDLVVDDCEPNVFDLGSHEEPRTAAFSPNGRWVGISIENRVAVWEVNGYHLRHPRILQHQGPVNALAFSPDSTTVATAGEDGQVNFWNAQTGEWLSSRDLPIGRLGGIAYSPDGLACIAGGERRLIAVWNLGEADTGEQPPDEEEDSAPPDETLDSGSDEEEVEVDDSEDAPDAPAWVAVQGPYLPAHALIVGREADGTPLYAARAAHRGGMYLGKFRPGFGGANVGYRRREITLVPFEVLTGSSTTWVPASDGDIPAEAVECGHDDKGNPFYLVRGAIGEGRHPGRIASGMSAARLPFGGVEIEVQEYEVLIASDAAETEEESAEPTDEPLLSWDFENVMSVGAVSTSAGVSSQPKSISGFVSQTGGGPAEDWGERGTVFLTRFLGTYEVFLWFTIIRPMTLDSISFRHWHNHNPGYPTCPSYQVQLQFVSDEEITNLGQPLTLSNETSDRSDTVAIGRRFEPGSYKIRWWPGGLRKKRDTGTEFFAMKDLRLDGRFE